MGGCKQAVIWYNHLTMTHPTPIDITTMPDLARIVEEVEATKTPRELRRENKTVAVIMPARRAPAKKKREKTKADYEAFLSAAGGWKGLVDTEQLKKDIYESRKIATRPAIKL
jgi:hypothetical protein